MVWAFEQEDLDAPQKAVLLALAYKADVDAPNVTVETVCKLTRLGRSTVQRALKRLVLAGLVVATGNLPDAGPTGTG